MFLPKYEFNASVEEILRGSFDLHLHAAPDATREWRLDALDTARYAQEAGMGGFVFKSHQYPTAPLAYALNRMYPGLKVFGAIALNKEVGGLNPDAVEMAAGLESKVVWMPTFASDFQLTRQGQGPGIKITDDNDRLRPQVHDILDIIKQHDMVLASGHVSPKEALVLFKAAKEKGVQRIIATHPSFAATMEEQREMISYGAYLEYCFLGCMPTARRTDPEELMNTLRTLGVERCILTTDFGWPVNPPGAEGMRMAIATLLRFGMEAHEVAQLVKVNTSQLLGVG